MSDGPSAGGRWDEEDEAARMSTPELKPCPFCGSNSIHIGTVSNTGGNITYLRCGNCSADGPWANQETREVKWNTRHNPAESEESSAVYHWIERHIVTGEIAPHPFKPALEWISDRWHRKIEARDEALNAAREALQRFATAELNESNCASVEIANKRIRNLAKAALTQIDKALSLQQSKTT